MAEWTPARLRELERLCECGCGQPTPIATTTHSRYGRFKGQPQRFVRGHNAFANRRGYTVSDQGYTTPCWLYNGRIIPETGYPGFIRWNGRHAAAYRIYFEMHRGPIPDGLTLDHLCRVRHCVNPDHLEAVPIRVNTLRGDSPAARNAAKTHCVRGHAFDSENTAYDKRGRRSCKACKQELQRRRRLAAVLALAGQIEGGEAS